MKGIYCTSDVQRDVIDSNKNYLFTPTSVKKRKKQQNVNRTFLKIYVVLVRKMIVALCNHK